jgi:UPF0755 protein
MYDTVNLASIIEREAKGEEEKKNVADVLIKRLDGKGDGTKLLAVDAPFLFELKNWKYVITNETKAKNTPYNTYMNPGLPATPISNPGLDSLSSVLNPTKNDYLSLKKICPLISPASAAWVSFILALIKLCPVFHMMGLPP